MLDVERFPVVIDEAHEMTAEQLRQLPQIQSETHVIRAVACQDCGNVTAIPTGSCTTCTMCGSTSGCG